MVLSFAIYGYYIRGRYVNIEYSIEVRIEVKNMCKGS